jgi:hypothetical protein
MVNDLRIMLDLYEFSDYVKDPSLCQRIKVESLLNEIYDSFSNKYADDYRRYTEIGQSVIGDVYEALGLLQEQDKNLAKIIDQAYKLISRIKTCSDSKGTKKRTNYNPLWDIFITDSETPKIFQQWAKDKKICTGNSAGLLSFRDIGAQIGTQKDQLDYITVFPKKYFESNISNISKLISKAMRKENLYGIIDGTNWNSETYTFYYPNLKINPSVFKKKSKPDNYFIKAIYDMYNIFEDSDFKSRDNIIREEMKKLSYNITDESEFVKGNERMKCLRKYPGEDIYCFYHLKYEYIRMHFTAQNEYLYISYLGSHLATKKF